MVRSIPRLPVVAALALLVACGDDGTEPTDAAALDAGGQDAGGEEDGGGGEDSGARDAGSPDAAARDAGHGDAGVDAGLFDAGRADAGRGDAGGADAGRADAGAADGGSAACDPSAVAFPMGGSLAPGTLCDEVYACAVDRADADRIEAASDVFECTPGAEPASTCGAFTCSYRDPGGPSVLDEAEIAEICKVTVLEPTPVMRCVVFL